MTTYGEPVTLDAEAGAYLKEVNMNSRTTERVRHTPGPWALDETLPPNGRSVIARTTAGRAISAQTEGPHDPASDEANARLIAAAPDLLAALKALVSRVGWNEEIAEVRVAAAAIRQAEGGA